MHDIRAIRENPEAYDKAWALKGLPPQTPAILDLDAKLRAALRAETTAATVFIVSQRIGTVMHADRIIVLDDGRVVGIGRHAELLETCAVYREIAESQASLEVA